MMNSSNITYSFIANCQTAVVHNNKTKRMSKIYKSQYIFRYNILTVKLQSVIREMRYALYGTRAYTPSLVTMWSGRQDIVTGRTSYCRLIVYLFIETTSAL